MAALQNLSINCNLGSYLHTALRNQLVFGLLSRRIQSRLLETKNLTLEKAVETATAMELTDHDLTQLQAGPATVDYMGKREATASNQGKAWSTRKTPGRGPAETESEDRCSATHANFPPNINTVCFRCGGNHYASKCKLNRNIVCNNCGVKGHVRKVCMKRNQEAANELNIVKLVQGEHTLYREKFVATTFVEGKKVNFEVHSGAAVTIVSRDFLKSCLPNAKVRKTNLELVFVELRLPSSGTYE